LVVAAGDQAQEADAPADVHEAASYVAVKYAPFVQNT
jgi:hypothetical protein